MTKLQFNTLIDGELINNNNWIDIISPIDLKIYGSVPFLKEKDIEKAFISARKNQKKWENLSLFNRIEYLEKLLNLLIINKHELSKICSYEIGKNIKDSLNEIERSIDYIKYTIEETKRLNPLSLTGDGWNIKNKIGIFKRIAKGVVLAISPFNYPINLSISKIIPSLIMGNTVVFKPALNGSMSGLFLAKLFYKIKLPKGVFNVVTGPGKEIGDLLIKNKEVDLISFTGSFEIGNRIKKLSNGKELILELGGKDPALVLKDADLLKASKEIVEGAFSYSGQRCTAIKIVLVDDIIANELIFLIKNLIKKLSIGNDPLENNTIIPLINIDSSNFVQELIDDSLNKKANLIFGNIRKKNLFFPTLIDNIKKDMRLAWEEQFGPVLPIIRCKNELEMIEWVNKSKFGLQASIFTKNINKIFELADKLETGTININNKSQRGPDSFPFLGIKNSGQGVQGIKDSLLSVSRIKGLIINY